MDVTQHHRTAKNKAASITPTYLIICVGANVSEAASLHLSLCQLFLRNSAPLFLLLCLRHGGMEMSHWRG
jgi:hypothetical protein